MDAVKAKVIFQQLARELRSMAESGEQLSLALDTGPHLERGQQIFYSSCRRPFVPLFRRLRKRASRAMAEWRPDRYALDRACYLGRDPFTDKIFGLGKPHVYAWTESSRHVTEVPDLLTAASDLMESFVAQADRSLRGPTPPRALRASRDVPDACAQAEPTDLVSNSRAAEVAQVAAKTISRWIKAGSLPVYGPRNRASVSELVRLLPVLSQRRPQIASNVKSSPRRAEPSVRPTQKKRT